MKKIILLVAIILAGQMVFAQAYFPTVDSLRRYIDRFVRNSAIESFTNLRINTALKGLAQHIDSAKLQGGGSAAKDTLQSRLGLRFDSIGVNKIRGEYLGRAFSNTADLRSYTGTITSDLVFRVKNDSAIIDYVWDPVDVLSADNGVTVIVNAGKRLKPIETILNGRWFGMKGDFNSVTGTGTDNTPAMRKIFSLFTGSKDARNVTVQVGAGEFGFSDTLATPNSAGFFRIRGEGRYTTTLWYKGPVGKDFLTLRNSQKPILEDFEMAAFTKPSAMIRLTTDENIIGSSGMVSHAIIRNVEMRGNRGVFDYGIRKTSSPGHDQNNEQTYMENVFIDLADIAAYSNEMLNALWDRAENCLFRAKRTAIRIGKPNPGSAIDSAGGSLDMINCTLMSYDASDTLIYNFGGQVSILNGRNEGMGMMLLYSRKSAEGSRGHVKISGGTWNMGQGWIYLGWYNIDSESTNITLDDTWIYPLGLLKLRLTDSLTTTYIRGGNVQFDTLQYSAKILHEIPGYTGNGNSTAIKLYAGADKGDYKITGAVSNYRQINSGTTIRVSGENVYSLNPSGPTIWTNFTDRAVYDEIILVPLNANSTVAHNANIITPTGANYPLRANNPVRLIRTSEALGGVWLLMDPNAGVQVGLTMNRVPLWDGSKFINSSFEESGGIFTSFIGITAPTLGATSSINVTANNPSLTINSNLAAGSGRLIFQNSSGAADESEIRITGPGSAPYTPRGLHFFTAGQGGFEFHTYDGGAGEGTFKIMTGATTEQFRVGPNFTLLKASNYLNWGTTTGTTGYGFRDNGGVMEWKNSGGAWAAFSAGGGGGLGDPGGNGVVVRTALNTTINRTLTGTTNRIVISNQDGTGGNPTFDIGTDVVTIGGTQTLTNKTLTTPTINRITSSGSTPTFTAGAAAGTGPTITITGNDMTGQISVTTGTSPASNDVILDVNFTSSYANAPNVIFCPASANISTGVYMGTIAVNAFSLVATGALTASTNYKWNYWVIGK